MNKKRCAWVTKDPIYIRYHDEEWGRLDRFFDDHYLFEMLVLEGAQAGLSWLTILKRREHYRRAFSQFDPQKVARYDEQKINELLNNQGIIRHERKIRSAINNARAFLEIQAKYGDFHKFLWDFFDNKQTINHWNTPEEVPAETAKSKQLSEKLKSYGFTFVGPIICYSFMQAIGIVDDHIQSCWMRKNIKGH